MHNTVENHDAPEDQEPTGVVTVKLGAVVPLAESGGYGLARFEVPNEDGNWVPRQVLVRASYVEAGGRAIFVPNDSVLPNEPEFSYMGAARRRLRARSVCGERSDGMLISYDDAAYIMSRRAVRMAQTAEEVEMLTGKDADYLFDCAREALAEIPIGADIGNGLGIFPYVAAEEQSA